MADATTPGSHDLIAFVETQRQVVRRGWPATVRGDVNALHRVRVATRRLREAVGWLASADLADRTAARAVDRAAHALERLTRQLGPVRELDVSADELAAATRHHGWAPDLAARLIAPLEARRTKRRDRLVRWMARDGRRDDLDRRIRDVQDALAEAGVRPADRAPLDRTVRRIRDVRAAAAGCGTLYEPERLHALRIAVKKLRYALELWQATGHAAVGPSIATLTKYQRRLGVLHDRQALQAELGRGRGSRKVGEVVAVDIATDALERDCRALHAEIVSRMSKLVACLDDIRRTLLAAATGLHTRGMARAGGQARARRAGDGRP